MRKKPLFIAAATAVALGLGGLSVTAFAEETPKGEIDEKLLQKRADALAETAGASVIAEARSGDDTWEGASGTRKAGGEAKAKPDDHVRVGSITKSLVTTVAMQLVEDKKLDLDAKVQDLAPDLIPYKDAITVRQLLNHTSGVPDYFVDVYPSLAEGSFADIEHKRLDEYTPEEVVTTATKRDLDFKPGEKYSYSNTGYYIVGLLLEEITGSDIEDELTERVIKPSGMGSTSVPQQDPDIADPNTDAYFDPGNRSKRWNTTELSPTQLWAAGATVSNPHDINKFYRHLFEGDLISDASLKEMRQFTKQSEGTYGLALVQDQLGDDCSAAPDGKVQGHSGGTLGHTSWSLSTPDGETQLTFSMGLDPQGMPEADQKEISTAMSDLLVAGLCGDSKSSSDTKTPHSPLQDPLQQAPTRLTN